MKKAAIVGSPSTQQIYRTALQKAGCDAVIFPDCSYIKKHPAAFDGLLLPGGGDVFSLLSDYSFPITETTCGLHNNSHLKTSRSFSGSILLDLEQLTALDLFYRAEKPVLGICKGMQLINLYFHGSIREVLNRRLHQAHERDVFHPASNEPGFFLHALFGPDMLINSNHHQCIQEPGSSLRIIQYAPDHTAEAIAHLTAPIIGTQWHPERMPESNHQDTSLLFKYFVSLL